MSNIFFVSDLHINHGNIIRYSQRPYRGVAEMDAALITNWNSVVQPNDTVYNLGDFMFSDIKNIKNVLRRLNGTKHHIFGNHDKEIIANSDDLISEGLLSSVQDYLKLKINGQVIIMMHYGMRVWDKSHHGAWHVYGHSHGTLPPHGLSVDVGVDCKEITTEYRPISLDELGAYMSKRKAAVVDHHGAK